MASVLTEAYFQDEAAAFERLEAIVWKNGPVCPHCGAMGRIGSLAGVRSKPSKKNPEGVVRHGLRKCYDCRGQFTVRKGTVFEDSHVPLHIWFQAAYLMCSSKKGVSSNQLHRTLGVTLQTAWFMSHRLREAMRDGTLAPLGGAGGVIEADTTFIGGKEKNKHVGKRNARNIGGVGKQIVHTLVERNGRARSHHIPSVNSATLRPILNKHADKKSVLMTDTAGGYLHVGKTFASHEMVDHGADEYVRGDAYTNTVEGFFGILKRGITGICHHVSEAHLHRYLAEFDFRYSNRIKLGCGDLERTERALGGIVGKRLTYRDSSCA